MWMFTNSKESEVIKLQIFPNKHLAIDKRTRKRFEFCCTQSSTFQYTVSLNYHLSNSSFDSFQAVFPSYPILISAWAKKLCSMKQSSDCTNVTICRSHRPTLNQLIREWISIRNSLHFNLKLFKASFFTATRYDQANYQR